MIKEPQEAKEKTFFKKINSLKSTKILPSPTKKNQADRQPDFPPPREPPHRVALLGQLLAVGTPCSGALPKYLKDSKKHLATRSNHENQRFSTPKNLVLGNTLTHSLTHTRCGHVCSLAQASITSCDSPEF